MILISINPRVSFSSFPLLPIFPHKPNILHVKATCKKTENEGLVQWYTYFTFRNQEKASMAKKHNALKSYWIALFLQKGHSVPWHSLPTKSRLWSYMPDGIYGFWSHNNPQLLGKPPHLILMFPSNIAFEEVNLHFIALYLCCKNPTPCRFNRCVSSS